MPVLEIYRKYLRIKPRQFREALFDMGEELVTVSGYALPIPPLDDMAGELAAALRVLPPLVVVSGGLGIVVIDHHPEHPVFHLPPFEEAVDGFLFGLVELEDHFVEEVGTIAPGDPLRGLVQVVIVPGEIAVEGHSFRRRRL